MTRDEIITLASRYINPDDKIDFPLKNDVFCLLKREIPDNTVLTDEEGWIFGGYGICLGYLPDEQSKPIGKWIFMHFASLDTFPPSAQVLKLQPPHIVNGRFQNPERTKEIRILKIGLDQNSAKKNINNESAGKSDDPPKNDYSKKTVRFRKKNLHDSTQKNRWDIT